MALAHGGHKMGHGGGQPRYELCTVEGCDLVGAHQHDSGWYCNQTGWQADYVACSVEGCSQLGIHEHDGVYYRCSYQGGGHGCGRWQNW